MASYTINTRDLTVTMTKVTKTALRKALTMARENGWKARLFFQGRRFEIRYNEVYMGPLYRIRETFSAPAPWDSRFLEKETKTAAEALSFLQEILSGPSQNL